MSRPDSSLTVKVIEPAPVLELLDPQRITVRNIRESVPGKQLTDSVRKHGLLQPIGVLRTPGGELVLRFGARRRAACIEAGIKALAIVIDGDAGTPEAEIERIFTQWDENENRENLTAGEKAAAVASLFEYGADGGTVSRRTGLDRAAIAAARKLAASETARTLAAQYPLDLTQAAVVAEFDDDPETAAELARTARDEPAQFEHVAEQAREDRAEAAMIAARAAELTAQGITVATGYLPYEKRIEYWNGADGRQLTPEAHKDCPGAVVFLRISGYDENRRAEETCYCTDPKGNGHKKRTTSGDTGTSEEQAAERQRVIEGNKAWRAATIVRQRWLRDVLLARKALQDGAALFTAWTLASADSYLIRALSTMQGGQHAMARELLGGIGKETWDSKTRAYVSPLADSLDGVSEQRALMVTLAMVIGAHESQAADDQTWRAPTRVLHRYLTTLAGWGYTLSPIEQALAGTGANQAGQPAAGQES